MKSPKYGGKLDKWPVFPRPSKSLLSLGVVCAALFHFDSQADLPPRTAVTPVLNAPVVPGTNLLYCGSFQLAWNEMSALLGSDVRLEGDPPLGKELNRHVFTKTDLDAADCVALAGTVQSGIIAHIKAAVTSHFGPEEQPQLLPSPTLAPRPQDIVAYALLRKKLAYPVPFERASQPMRFGSAKVACFGMADYKTAHLQMYPQVQVIDYQNTNDFVIELKTKTETDRLILARVSSRPTLAETVAQVQDRLAKGKPRPAQSHDILLVPELALDITQQYGELLRRRLLHTNSALAHDLLLLSAVQRTQFRMDEKGVDLKSEAHLAFGCSMPPRPKRVMVFNKPFLVMLQHRSAKTPYFALWVENPELFTRK